jgi:acyl-CoA thioesterase I
MIPWHIARKSDREGDVGPLVVCFIGDSIIAGTGDSGALGWIGRLTLHERRSNSELVAYNLGVNSDTVREVAARWRGECELRFPAGCQALTVFGFGQNDASEEEDGNPRVDGAEALKLARRIVLDALTISDVLWVGPTPIDETSQPRRVSTGQLRCKKNSRIRSISETYRLTAESLSVPYLDLFGMLGGDPDWIGALADGVHPSAKGYDRIAHMVGNWFAWRQFFDHTSPAPASDR